MTIDQLRADLLLVVAVGNYVASALSALGDSVTESELAASGRNTYLSNYIIDSVPKDVISKIPEVRVHLENCTKDIKASDFLTLQFKVLTIHRIVFSLRSRMSPASQKMMQKVSLASRRTFFRSSPKEKS